MGHPAGNRTMKFKSLESKLIHRHRQRCLYSSNPKLQIASQRFVLFTFSSVDKSRCTWHKNLTTSSIWGYGLSAHSFEVIVFKSPTYSMKSMFNFLKLCMIQGVSLSTGRIVVLHEMSLIIPITYSVPPSSVSCFSNHCVQDKCTKRSKKESTFQQHTEDKRHHPLQEV